MACGTRSCRCYDIDEGSDLNSSSGLSPRRDDLSFRIEADENLQRETATMITTMVLYDTSSIPGEFPARDGNKNRRYGNPADSALHRDDEWTNLHVVEADQSSPQRRAAPISMLLEDEETRSNASPMQEAFS